MVCIREDPEPEVLFLGKFPVAVNSIGTHPDNDSPETGKFIDTIGESTGFKGTPRGIVPGIEVEYHPSAGEIAQAALLSLCIREAEGRSGFPEQGIIRSF
jgi:hypothetical protein